MITSTNDLRDLYLQASDNSLAWEMLAQVAAPKAPTFSSCSQAQQGPITSALAQAVNMVSSAKTALDGAPGWARYTARRYSEWFGAYDAGRYSTVSNHYAKILDALSNQAMKFNCDCSEKNIKQLRSNTRYSAMLKGLSRRQLRYPWMVLKMGDKVHLASIVEVETGVAVIVGIKPQAIAGHVFNPGDFVWLKPDQHFTSILGSKAFSYAHFVLIGALRKV